MVYGLQSQCISSRSNQPVLAGEEGVLPGEFWAKIQGKCKQVCLLCETRASLPAPWTPGHPRAGHLTLECRHQGGPGIFHWEVDIPYLGNQTLCFLARQVACKTSFVSFNFFLKPALWYFKIVLFCFKLVVLRWFLKLYMALGDERQLKYFIQYFLFVSVLLSSFIAVINLYLVFSGVSQT